MTATSSSSSMYPSRPPSRWSWHRNEESAIARTFEVVIIGGGPAGAEVLQPCSVTGLRRAGEGYLCHAEAGIPDTALDLRASVVIAAHGSWEPGPLPTQGARQSPRPGDLLGFKAHFRDSDLPAGL